MRKLMLIGLLTTVMLGASVSSASATTWSGTCRLEGKITLLDSPLTFRLEHHDFEITGKGTCEGTLDGVPYSGPATNNMDGRMNTPMSCATGISKGVPGSITFGDPRRTDAPRVEVVLGHVHGGSQALVTVAGAYNGHGLARIQFLGGQSSLEKCAGAGVNAIDYVVDVYTVTPLYG